MPLGTYPKPEDDFSEKFKAFRTRVDTQDVNNQLNTILQTPPNFQKKPESMGPSLGASNDDATQSFLGAVLGDIGTGLANSPMQAAGGVIDAVNETGDTVEDIGSLFGAQFAIPDINTTDAPESVTGGLIRSTFQFLTGFIGAQRPAKAIVAGAKNLFLTKGTANMLAKAQRKNPRLFSDQVQKLAGDIFQAEVAGGIATAFVFDPHEDRLSSYLNQIPGLSQIVPDYLADNNPDNETEWEGRLKNVLEGAALGTMAGALMGVFRMYKSRRINPEAPPQETMNISGGPKIEEPPIETPKNPPEVKADAEITLEKNASEAAPAGKGEPKADESSVTADDIMRMAAGAEREVPDELTESVFKSSSNEPLLTGDQVPSRVRNRLDLQPKTNADPLPAEITEFTDLLGSVIDEALLDAKPLGREALVQFDTLLTKFIRGIEVAESQFDTPAIRQQIKGLKKTDNDLAETGDIFDANVEAVANQKATGEVNSVLEQAQKSLDFELQAQKTKPNQRALNAAKEEVKRAKGVRTKLKAETGKIKRKAIKELEKRALKLRQVLIDPKLGTRRQRTQALQKFEDSVEFMRAAAKGKLRELSPGDKFRVKMERAENFMVKGADLGNTEPRESINISALEGDDPIGELVDRKTLELRALLNGFKKRDKQTLTEWNEGAQTRLRDLEETLGGPVGFRDPEEVAAFTEILASARQMQIDRHRIALMPDATDADVARAHEAEIFNHMVVTHFEQSTSAAGRTLRSIREARRQQGLPLTSRERIQDIEDAIRSGGGTAKILERGKAYLLANDDPTMLNKLLREYNKPGVTDMIYEVFINGILSGVGSHFRNVVSTNIFSAYSLAEGFWNAGISKTFMKGEVSWEEASSRAYGYAQGMRNAYRLARNGAKDPTSGHLNTEFERQRQLDIAYPEAITSEAMGLDPGSSGAYAVNMLGKFIRLPTKALQMEDKASKAVGYYMELFALAERKASAEGLDGLTREARVREIVDNPPDSIHADSMDKAHYITFTNRMGPGFQAGVHALRQVPMGRFVVPFINTPSQILLRSWERSPFAWTAKSWRDAVSKGGPEAAEAWGRMTMGSTLMMTVGTLAHEGLITGAGPDNKDMQRAMRATGWRPYSIKMGDAYVAYDKLDPIGNLFSWGANIGEIVNHLGQDDAEFMIGSAVIGLGQHLSSERYLRGLFDAIGAIDPTNPVKTPEGWLQRFLPSLAPYSSFARGMARAIDPNLRVLRTAAGDPDVSEFPGISEPYNVWMDNTFAQFRNVTPGLSASLPLDRDLEGNEIKSPAQVWTALDFLSPNWASIEKKDKPSTVIRENQVPITRVGKYIDGVELTRSEYSEYQRLSGEFYASQIHTLVNSSGFDSLSAGPDGMKANLIRELIRKSRQFGRQEMKSQYPDLLNRIFTKDHILRTSDEAAAIQVDTTPGDAAFPFFEEEEAAPQTDVRALLGGRQ